jgi:hypothetical protein
MKHYEKISGQIRMIREIKMGKLEFLVSSKKNSSQDILKKIQSLRDIFTTGESIAGIEKGRERKNGFRK